MTARRAATLVPLAAALLASGCTTADLATASADGCTPPRQIYQPPSRMGGASSFIYLPGSCPARVAQAATAAPGTTPGTPAKPIERRVPPPLPDARTAIANGVERLCGWALSGESHSLDGMFNAAYDAGYARGSSVNIVPLPEMRREPAYSALGFQARITDAPAEGGGVAAFVSFHNPVCQLQVYGYADAARAYVAGLEDAGWRRVGAERAIQTIAAQRWYGRAAGRPTTLVVNRWTGAQAPGGLGFILNVVPGEDAERGVLD